MKNSITTFVLVIVAFAFLSACDNTDASGKKSDYTLTISSSDTLKYNLGTFGDEEEADILVQANHFKISQLKRDTHNSDIIYQYKAKDSFKGIDAVTLSSFKGSDGASPNHNIQVTQLTIIVK